MYHDVGMLILTPLNGLGIKIQKSKLIQKYKKYFFANCTYRKDAIMSLFFVKKEGHLQKTNHFSY